MNLRIYDENKSPESEDVFLKLVTLESKVVVLRLVDKHGSFIPATNLMEFQLNDHNKLNFRRLGFVNGDVVEMNGASEIREV